MNRYERHEHERPRPVRWAYAASNYAGYVLIGWGPPARYARHVGAMYLFKGCAR